MKTLLKEDDQGVDRVIRALKYQRRRAKGRTRKRLESQLTYFRNQRPRMRYAGYMRAGLPIASGVIEASCKTLVTQRMKQSGMAWTQMGGQAILTLRSLIQSSRWQPAWELLRADFRTPVFICYSQATLPAIPRQEQAWRLHQSIDHFDFTSIPWAG